MNKRMYLSPPHMTGKEIEYVNEAFASNWIAPVGPHLENFEREICNYTGARHAVALNSGTAAIHLALKLSNVAKNDEIVCSTFTFAGSAFPILYEGALPVFVDSEASSWNMDPNLFEDAITERIKNGKKPKAVIVVHLYGQSADLEPIIFLCNKYDIILIEDAAESVGATYKGHHTGTYGEYGIFSFNGNKIITTSGGGMLVGKNRETIEKARFYATQARDPAPHYEHSHIGFNYRMSNVIAAIGRGQLLGLEVKVQRKKEIFNFYKKHLASLPGITFTPEASFGEPNYWLTCIIVDPEKVRCTREDIRLALEQENIESRPLWKPMHLQPVFKPYPAFCSGVSERLFENGLCLPSGTAMNEENLMQVIDCIKKKIVI